MSNEYENVFVYGTLKSGHGANHYLATSTMIGVARTVDPYTVGGRGFPVAIPDKEGSPLSGELYRVHKSVIPALDRYEGYPSFYTKTKRPVVVGGETMFAFIYEGNEAKAMVTPDNKLEPKEGVLTWR